MDDTTDTRQPAAPDRTLVLGDSHGSRLMVREALRVAQALGCARVVSAGDFGVWPGSSGKQFLDVVDRMAGERSLQLYVAPGNHDDYDQLEAAEPDDDGWLVLREHVRAAPRGLVARFGGLRWLLCGGAASIDGPGGIWGQNRGPLEESRLVRDGRGNLVERPPGFDLGGWWPQERITQADVEACREAARSHGPIDVMVTHEAPAEVDLRDTHKPLEPGAWPMGERQRELVSEIRAAVRPTVGFAGHWHQHALHRDETGVYTVLSADVAPEQIQWAIVDDDGGSPRVWLPARWSRMVSLTARGARGRLDSRHKAVTDIGEGDLVEVDLGPPEPYSWPEG